MIELWRINYRVKTPEAGIHSVGKDVVIACKGGEEAAKAALFMKRGIPESDIMVIGHFANTLDLVVAVD